jgi:hypothetical protein
VKNLSKTPARTYVYMVILFSVLVLAYSLYVLYSAIGYYQRGDTMNFYYGIFASGVGIVLAISSFMHMRRRLLAIQRSILRVLTTVICEKCGFKIVRNFGVGDYVHRQVGKCQQCDGTMYITSVYAEEPLKGASSLLGFHTPAPQR